MIEQSRSIEEQIIRDPIEDLEDCLRHFRGGGARVQKSGNQRQQ